MSQVLWGALTEGIPHLQDKGASRSTGCLQVEESREGVSGGSLLVQYRTERKRSAVRRASAGELSLGSEARFPPGGRA